MAKDNIKLTISAKDLATGTIGKVRASTIALGTAVGQLGARMVTAAINGARSWIDSALECERANVKLDAALRGTGRYTDELSRQMQDVAAAIQNETAANDEAMKATMAMLLTMGVAPEKIGQAARAVEALSALNYEGAQAARAVALAMNGNMTMFNRMVPAVRDAKTEEEKVVAVNNLLRAGYEQQRASLQTVGGAWNALKGRLDDARQALLGAIFEGLRLGEAFGTAERAVGKFLESESFKAITDKLRDGAGYVRQMVRAMDSVKGAKEVASAMGEVIYGALKDGAEYIAAKITGATVGKVRQWRGVDASHWGGLGKAWGALFKGEGLAGMEREWSAHMKQADKRMKEPVEPGAESKHMAAALAKLNTIIKKRADNHEKAAQAEQPALDEAPSIAAAQFDIADAQERDRAAMERIARADSLRVAHAERLERIQEDIASAAERERAAQEKSAKLQEQRRNAIEQNINQWIAGVQGRREDAKRNEADVKKAEKKAADLRRRRDAGTRLSRRDAQWLEDLDRNIALRRPGRVQEAADAAALAAQEREDLEKHSAKVQEDQLAELKQLNKHLETALEVS